MKKWLYAAAILIMGLMMAGCSPDWQETGVDYNNFRSMLEKCETKKGTYSLYSQDLEKYMLYYRYIDKEGYIRSHLICQQESCWHMTRECPAFYKHGSSLMGYDWKNRIYLLEKRDTTHDAAEGGTLYIWRIDPEKQVKELYLEYFLDMNSEGHVRWQEECLYNGVLYLQVGYGKENQSLLVTIDLQNGECQKSVPWEEKGQKIDLIGVDDEALYWQQGDNAIYRQLKDGRVELVYESDDRMSYGVLMADQLFYIQKEQVFRYEMATGEVEVIPDTPKIQMMGQYVEDPSKIVMTVGRKVENGTVYSGVAYYDPQLGQLIEEE
ncbi:MAG: hypothetical protein IJ315_10015 [Firmicutes bacterium]|nr:hypothetical protein [Bacillota bacterium]